MNMKWKSILLILGVIGVFTAGVLMKGKVDSILQGAHIGETNSGDKTGGDKTGRDKVGGNQNEDTQQAGRDVVSGIQTKGSDGGIGNIQAQPGSNVKITIQAGDPKYQNRTKITS